MPPDVTTINIGLCYQLATKFTEIIALVSRVIRNRQTDVNTRKWYQEVRLLPTNRVTQASRSFAELLW